MGALAVLATAAPAMARKAQFTVNLAGNGLYTNQTTDHVTKLSGICKDTSTERTSFSFTGVGILGVSFSSKGMTGDSYTLKSGNDWAVPQASPTTLTKSSSGRGCNPPFGADMTGSYQCSGKAIPHSLGKSAFKLSAAARGKRSTLRVIGPAEFAAGGLSGPWTYQTGSCRGLSGTALLQTMGARVPSALGPRIPIPERSLRHLHVGQYLQFGVSEGHLAPQIDDAKQCAANKGLDTCRQTFSWGGQVVLRRLK